MSAQLWKRLPTWDWHRGYAWFQFTAGRVRALLERAADNSPLVYNF
jgi:hypothetical protein